MPVVRGVRNSQQKHSEMTIDDFFDKCWRDLPPIRRSIVGRVAAKRMLVDTVIEFDAESVAACKTADDYQQYEGRLLAQVKGASGDGKRYGFAIATLILWAVLSAIIQWVVLWWLNHLTEQQEFETMRGGLSR